MKFFVHLIGWLVDYFSWEIFYFPQFVPIQGGLCHCHSQKGLLVWTRYEKLFMSRNTEQYGKVWRTHPWLHSDLSPMIEEELLKVLTLETSNSRPAQPFMMRNHTPHGSSSLLRETLEKGKQFTRPVYGCNTGKPGQKQRLEQSNTEEPLTQYTWERSLRLVKLVLALLDQ